jgi:hypothetical protein
LNLPSLSVRLTISNVTQLRGQTSSEPTTAICKDVFDEKEQAAVVVRNDRCEPVAVTGGKARSCANIDLVRRKAE